MTRSSWLFIVLILLAARISSADQACSQQCWVDFYNCPCGDYWSCAACDQTRDSCLAYCDTCPATRDYTTSTVTGRQATGRNGCYEDHIYFNGGRRYAEYFTTERRDTYRETINCNGTRTTTLIGTGTITYYCWARDPIATCSPYALNTLPICH